MGADLLERARERPDVGIRQVAEVLLDSVPVVAAGSLHGLAPRVRKKDEDRAAVVLRTDAPNEAGFLHPVDDAGEAALAVQDPLGELGVVLLVLIGADAATDWLPAEIARDSHGFLLTGLDAMQDGSWNSDRQPYALETSVPGIFAVGDVRSGSVKRVAAAVGEGGTAIALVHRYLQPPA
jgi:hypothetical protein